MFALQGKIQKLLDAWFRLCTGHSAADAIDDEEHYRQRILVMTTLFWLLTVVALTLFIPRVLDLTPEGRMAADILFVATAVGVLVSMLLLRVRASRTMALHAIMVIYTGAFAGACMMFGGTESPTYPLLMLGPVMAAIAGSVAASVGWGVIVLAIWFAILIMERNDYQFLQIIAAENHSLAVFMGFASMAFAVVSVINIYAEMNKSLRQRLQASNEELAHLSSHDQLTRLPNRRFYDERISLALRRAADRHGMVALLIIDLNDFKKINDTYGHGAGDKILATVAERIQDHLRETDLVARLGGDEFAAVLEDVKSPEQVTRIANKLSMAIEQPVSIRQQKLTFGASIGVAIFPLDGRQLQELEEKADRAMYQAKKRGLPVALSSLEAVKGPWPVKPPLRGV